MSRDHTKIKSSFEKFEEIVSQKNLIEMEATLVVEEVLDSYITAKNLTTTGVKLGQLFRKKDNKDKDSEVFQVVKSAEISSLMPIDTEVNIEPGTILVPYITHSENSFETSAFLGRVIDGLGNPLDDLGSISKSFKNRKNKKEHVNPLKRKRIKEIVTTGIKAIDGLLTIGRGQRIGIMAGSGVGKTTTLSMIARNSSEEINVIALIGERGREVREFIEKELGEEGLAKSVVVVATSDQTPLLQIRAAELATKMAVDFREEGKNVLLMMDSVTRYLQARRTVDLANGDIPMMGGRTTSMEPSIQKMFESAGNSDRGSITGIYTVLVEGEDFESPIPDMARGILDGHIILTRELANLNHYPAIDVLASISRVMQDIVSEDDLKLANEVKKRMSIYKNNEDQISLGLVRPGASPEIDKSIELKPKIDNFLQQDQSKYYSRDETMSKMNKIFTEVPNNEEVEAND